MTVWIADLPPVDRSPDPFDNFLLSMAQGGGAEMLVSGAKRGVLALKSHDAFERRFEFRPESLLRYRQNVDARAQGAAHENRRAGIAGT